MKKRDFGALFLESLVFPANANPNKTIVQEEEPSLKRPATVGKPASFVKGHYSCSFPGCNGLFNSTSNKRRHERLHTGIKPHKCTFEGCNKSFARNYDMKVHLRTHTKEKLYHCEVPGCSKWFSRNSSLREHERNLHGFRARSDGPKMTASLMEHNTRYIHLPPPLVQRHAKTVDHCERLLEAGDSISSLVGRSEDTLAPFGRNDHSFVGAADSGLVDLSKVPQLILPEEKAALWDEVLEALLSQNPPDQSL